MKREKSIPIGTFNIFIPINIPLSGTKEFGNRIEEECKKVGEDKTTYLRKFLLRGLRKNGIKGFKDLLEQSGDYKTIKNSVNDSINGFLGTSNRSRYFEEELTKEWDKDAKK